MNQLDEKAVQEAVYTGVSMALESHRSKAEAHLNANLDAIMGTIVRTRSATGISTWACFVVLCAILWRVW